MGNGMNKILPGLFVGNFRDSKDEKQLKENKITHILSIHDNAKPYRSDMIYLCLDARDVGTQDLSQYFSQCNDFIHSARIYGGSVLIHCLAGMSRSVTVTVAYIMTVTSLGWRDSLNVVRASRTCASPNFGFQRQLLAFQHDTLSQERTCLYQRHTHNLDLQDIDAQECQRLLEINRLWILHGDRKAEDDSNTYPLPHNAYQTQPGPTEDSNTYLLPPNAYHTQPGATKEPSGNNVTPEKQDSDSAALIDSIFYTFDEKTQLKTDHTDSDNVQDNTDVDEVRNVTHSDESTDCGGGFNPLPGVSDLDNNDNSISVSSDGVHEHLGTSEDNQHNIFLAKSTETNSDNFDEPKSTEGT